MCLCVAVLVAAAQKIQINNKVVNVGKTGHMVPVTATFELKNKTGKHLVISEVKTDCGCTAADYPAKSIGNGDKFTITMTYDARMLGHFKKQAFVYSNGMKEPLCLTMEGVVLAELKDYSKTYPYAFGDLLMPTTWNLTMWTRASTGRRSSIS